MIIFYFFPSFFISVAIFSWASFSFEPTNYVSRYREMHNTQIHTEWDDSDFIESFHSWKKRTYFHAHRFGIIQPQRLKSVERNKIPVLSLQRRKSFFFISFPKMFPILWRTGCGKKDFVFYSCLFSLVILPHTQTKRTVIENVAKKVVNVNYAYVKIDSQNKQKDDITK